MNFTSLKRQRSRTAFVLALAAIGHTACPPAQAQSYEWNVSLITEGGWNLTDNRAGWCNLLQAGGSVGLWQGACLEADALGTYRLHCPLADDLQGVSNIDAGPNRAFRLVQAGLSQQLGKHWRVFAGLRNVDTDHFDTPFTALFTGSSHGNFPILSGNFPLGTYPLSALALHLEYSPSRHFTVKETVYNGVADDRLNRQFRFRPGRDGVFNIGCLNYVLDPEEKHHGHYTLGYALGTQPDEENETAQPAALSYNYALWALAEQSLLPIGRTHLGALLQGGIAPTRRSACRYYWGAGLTLGGVTRRDGHVGLAVNRAIYADGTETDLELTGHFPLWKYLAVQPTLHHIRTNGRSTVAALLRISVEIGGGKD